MNWDAIEAISAAVATVATLGTLIYLAIQIRESNKLSKSASLQSVTEGYTDHVLVPLMQDPELYDVIERGHCDWTALSSAEKSAFLNYLVIEMLHINNVIQLMEKGLIGNADYEAWLARAASNLVTPGGKECWVYLQKNLAPGVVFAMNDFIDKHPNTSSQLDIYPFKVKFASDK
jgi:hypothetical protein